MTLRGYGDLVRRLRRLPGRGWCVLWHRRLWKPWRAVNGRYGILWTEYRCRRCWRRYTVPHADRLGPRA